MLLRRVVALCIDAALVMGFIVLPLTLLLEQYLPRLAAYMQYYSFAPWLPADPRLLLFVLYGAVMERSSLRATVGKLLTGTIVCRTKKASRNLERPTLARALWRNLLKWFSIAWIPTLALNVILVVSLGRRSVHEWLSSTQTYRRIKGQLRYGDELLRDHSLLPAARFDDHEQAGLYGEQLLLQQLEQMKGNTINAFGSSGNMVFNGRNYEIDAYALVPGLGIVVMEAKYYSGTLTLGNYDMWDRVDLNGENRPVKNSSKQVQRTVSIFADMLERHGLGKWPIYPLVVLTHPNAFIDGGGGHAFEGWVAFLDSLPQVLAESAQDGNVRFTAKDSARIKELIAMHEQAYQAA